jgi:hypothetical protein
MFCTRAAAHTLAALAGLAAARGGEHCQQRVERRQVASGTAGEQKRCNDMVTELCRELMSNRLLEYTSIQLCQQSHNHMPDRKSRLEQLVSTQRRH